MREIKFRVWDKVGEEMCRAEEETHAPETGDISLEIFLDGSFDVRQYKYWAGIKEKRWGCRDSEDFILMQYTGLKDKDEKEIWEGDIVECDHGKIGYIEYVDRHEGGGCFYPMSDEGFCEIFYDKERWYYLTVIGNIYENPSLLTNATKKT